MGSTRVIVPSRLAIDAKRIIRAVSTGMDAAAEACRVDFVATVGTWSTPATFEVASQGAYTRQITTGNKIWGMLNEGTKPHRILPKKPNGKLRFRTGYASKTTPGVLGSNSGGASGGSVFARGVNHPGTSPRSWDETAKDKYDDLLGKIVQRAIDAAVD